MVHLVFHFGDQLFHTINMMEKIHYRKNVNFLFNILMVIICITRKNYVILVNYVILAVSYNMFSRTYSSFNDNDAVQRKEFPTLYLLLI